MFTRLSELVESTILEHNGINQFRDFAVWKCSQWSTAKSELQGQAIWRMFIGIRWQTASWIRFQSNAKVKRGKDNQ